MNLRNQFFELIEEDGKEINYNIVNVEWSGRKHFYNRRIRRYVNCRSRGIQDIFSLRSN